MTEKHFNSTDSQYSSYTAFKILITSALHQCSEAAVKLPQEHSQNKLIISNMNSKPRWGSAETHTRSETENTQTSAVEAYSGY